MTYSFRNFYVDDTVFAGTVLFYSAVILRLEFSITNPLPSDIKVGWYRNRNYLSEMFGHHYDEDKDGSWLTFKFPWGSAAAGEVKGSEAGIVVDYIA